MALYENTEDGLVPIAGLNSNIVKVMPTPNVEYKDSVLQYVGDDGIYQKGVNYQCVNTNGTYSWLPVLPDSVTIKNKGKRVAVFGGSVAADGASYLKPILSATLSTEKIQSYAIGGAGFMAGTNFMQQITTATSEHPTEKIDVAVFWCSTNDYKNVARGTYKDYSYYDNWEAAVNNQSAAQNKCFKMLYDYNPEIEIYVILPLRWYGEEEGWDIYDSSWQSSDKRYPFLRWVDAIKQICNVWCVPFLDLWNASGINFYNHTTFLEDALHPNALGYRKIVPLIADFLRNGGYGQCPAVLNHQDENVWFRERANSTESLKETLYPCRNGDTYGGSAESDYVECLGDDLGGYYIRNGLAIVSLFFTVNGGNITTGSTRLLYGLPKMEEEVTIQVPIINRTSSQDHQMAYGYIRNIDTTSGERATVLMGDGFIDGGTYRGFAVYPVECR